MNTMIVIRRHLHLDDARARLGTPLYPITKYHTAAHDSGHLLFYGEWRINQNGRDVRCDSLSLSLSPFSFVSDEEPKWPLLALAQLQIFFCEANPRLTLCKGTLLKLCAEDYR